MSMSMMVSHVLLKMIKSHRNPIFAFRLTFVLFAAFKKKIKRIDFRSKKSKSYIHPQASNPIIST